MSTSEKKFKSKKQEKQDDSMLSMNHSKSIKYRLRVQQETEAEDEIKQFQDTEEFERYYKGVE